MNELEVLEAVEAAKGKQKEKILKDHCHNPRLRELIDAALNFKRKFYIKKFNEASAARFAIHPRDDVHGTFMQLLFKLENRTLTGNQAIESVEGFLSVCNDLELKWYARVIRKDLKADFGISTANKAGFDIPKFDVQLAKDAAKCKKLGEMLKKTVFLSPKLDGYRCVAVITDGDVMLMSRNGTVLENFPDVEASLSTLCPKGNWVFDGEIMSDDFNSMQKSAFAKVRGTTVGDVVYHVFDMIPYSEWDTDKFKTKAGQRYFDLETFFLNNTSLLKQLGNVRFVQHHKITAPSLDEIKHYEKTCIEAGFEGCMLNPDIPYYRGKPSNKMLKFKTMHTWDCPIIDLYPGKQGTKYEESLGGVTVMQENGVTCDVGSGFSDEERQYIWENKDQFKGKIIEVKYQELTEDNRMRFPIKVRWRQDKE